MKKYKNLLCCVLALVLLVALMFPLARTLAQASTYTLTVLNPVGQTAPQDNMPLADRQPLRDKLEAAGELGPVKILLLNYPKNGDELPSWGVAIAMEEHWEEQYPGLDVQVIPTDPSGGPATYGVVPPAWKWYEFGTVPDLPSPWGPKTGFGYIDGAPLQEEPFDRYQYWAKNFDFIIVGEDNCHMCTWWSSYHAKVLESLGTPVGVLATENYSTNAFISAQDDGFTRERQIVIDELRRVVEKTQGIAPTRRPAPAGSADEGVDGQWFDPVSVYANRQLPNGRVNIMVEQYKQPPLSPVLLQRAEPGVASRLYSDNEKRWMPEEHWRMTSKSVLEQAIWAAIGEETAEDKNPPPIVPEELGNLNYGVVGAAQELTFEAPTYEQALWKFMDFAKKNDFNDGMALIPPTPELVDEMLAATTRDRNDVIGYVYLRGGAMTIENIAINAVMCGLKPEAFPVFIAAAEALGHGWEEEHPWWHVMTGNTHELAMVVSGPIVNEIGMSTGIGQAGAGNPVNNALGRSVRMLWRNIARNVQPNLDVSNTTWRQVDPMILTVAENYDVTRELGWPTHSESLGFGFGSSSVTLVSVPTGGAGLLSSSAAWSANWTVSGLANLLPQGASASPNVPGLGSGMTWASYNYAGFITYSPAQARLLAANYASKQAFIDARAPLAEVVQNDPDNINNPDNPKDPTYDPDDKMGVTGNLVSLRYPIIVGEDPDGTHSMLSGFHLSSTFVNQKITGAAGVAATKTPSAVAPTAPSAPQNFAVGQLVLDEATGTYSTTLTWDAPKTDGGMPIDHYEFYFLSGLHELAFRWVEVPGGADASEVTVTNLLPGVQYEFKIRARNKVDNAAFWSTNGGELNMRASLSFNPRFAIKFSEPEYRTERMGGRGGWAVAAPVTPPGRYTVLNSNRYPQVEGQQGIKLIYIDPNKPQDERTYGPNGEIWNHLGERVDRAYVDSNP